MTFDALEFIGAVVHRLNRAGAWGTRQAFCRPAAPRSESPNHGVESRDSNGPLVICACTNAVDGYVIWAELPSRMGFYEFASYCELNWDRTLFGTA